MILAGKADGNGLLFLAPWWLDQYQYVSVVPVACRYNHHCWCYCYCSSLATPTGIQPHATATTVKEPTTTYLLHTTICFLSFLSLSLYTTITTFSTAITTFSTAITLSLLDHAFSTRSRLSLLDHDFLYYYYYYYHYYYYYYYYHYYYILLNIT